MLSELLIILLPLVMGYLISVHQPLILRFINYCLNWISYVILFFMGISLAFLKNISSNLFAIFCYSTITVTIILFFNIVSLLCLELIIPWINNHQQQEEKLLPKVEVPMDSLKLFSVIMIGFLIGLTGYTFLWYAAKTSKYILILLLFLIGIQLRNNGMTIKKIIFNKRAIIIAGVVTTSSLAAGILNAFILNLPVKIGLAMASGFGWYSLSKILLTESFGPIIGNAAFFNDFAREICAIILVPWIVQRSRSTALGLCGATSMDFTLPILQRFGGLELVSDAIAHGFILSLLVPILITFFSS